MRDVAALLEAVRAEPALSSCLLHHETLDEQAPVWAHALPAPYAGVSGALSGQGIDALYSHQARALELVADDADVVLATPAASGKTLVYNLPVLRDWTEDKSSRALYLFPLKALEHDQRKRLEADSARLGGIDGPRIAIYDGDTSPARRKKLRADPPHVLITNPDMLHLGILPHHAAWKHFFRNLRLVVIDELHAYRGVFGSHVAQVLRRLQRIASFHGAKFRFVAASATIANPGELAESLCGRPFRVVTESGAPLPRRHLLLLQPNASPYTLAARLFRLSVGLGLRTIAFTKARTITELMHTWIVDSEPGLRDKVSSYRAGFLPEERREIEGRLFSGELLGVISTSALEMGIDVGNLDVCILVGYPGSQVAMWQRSGRVGRSREAVIALVAQPDALDQYLVTHPRMLLDRGFEHAVVDPNNPEITGAHLPCAAAEVPLRATEAWLTELDVRARIQVLEDQGSLLRSEAGSEWFASRRLPHRDVNLRAGGETHRILLEDLHDDERPRLIGTIGSARVLSECHEGAIYLHRARQYHVQKLDLAEREVRVRAVRVAHYTRALAEKQTEILERRRSRPAGSFLLVEGRIRVTTQITSFERRRIQGQDLLGTEPLDLPPSSFETCSIWLEIPDEIPRGVENSGGHAMGGLHGTEHACLALFPLFALCDRHDMAGISSVRHAQTGHPAIFFYDAHPGGVGLVSSLFDRIEAPLEAALELISACPCEEGCPGCVHSPRCGSGNRPIDKQAAVETLQLLLAHRPLEALTELPLADPPVEAEIPRVATPARRLVFFDLETQRSAREVGGWHNAHLMRVALGVLYDTHTGRFESFSEAEVPDLLARLHEADLVVGFNVRRFDYEVLRAYTSEDLTTLPTFDMLQAIHSRLGFRVALGHLGEETLGMPKSGDGLQALQWWQEGRIDRLRDYCQQDVTLLRDLFHHAIDKGFLLFRTRGGERVRIPTRWSIQELLERAHERS